MTVTLRPFADSDLDVVFRWESDPAASRMAAFGRADPTDRSAFDAHYVRVRSNPDNTLLSIMHGDDFVGTIASFTIEQERELTYWIDPARWGRGIASAALETFLGVETTRPLFARAAAQNLGSNRVLLRNGFAKTGEETSFASGLGTEVVENLYRLD